MKNKETKLSKTEIKKCLWFWFGKLFIRLRDTDKEGRGFCISSGKRLYWTEGQAGHFIPNGSCKKHTRDENNVNFQSFSDNVKKYGNVLRYEDSLRKKIGDEYVDYLKTTKNDLKQRKEWEYVEMINEFRNKAFMEITKKSKKMQDEILLYIKKNSKKIRYSLYTN